MAKSGLFYVRFMDDILVLSPTRWKLRNAVKVVNHVLGSLNLEKRPDKTFIGRIERGFDFLGCHFGRDGLSVTKKTIEQFVERAIRLYEQEPGEANGSSRLGVYVRRRVAASPPVAPAFEAPSDDRAGKLVGLACLRAQKTYVLRWV